VAERSAALECNGEKRKPPAAGFGRKTIHGLHLRRVVGLLWFFSGDNVDLNDADGIPGGWGLCGYCT